MQTAILCAHTAMQHSTGPKQGRGRRAQGSVANVRKCEEVWRYAVGEVVDERLTVMKVHRQLMGAADTQKSDAE